MQHQYHILLHSRLYQKLFLERMVLVEELRSLPKFARTTTILDPSCRKWDLKSYGITTLLLCQSCFTILLKSLPFQECLTQNVHDMKCNHFDMQINCAKKIKEDKRQP